MATTVPSLGSQVQPPAWCGRNYTCNPAGLRADPRLLTGTAFEGWELFRACLKVKAKGGREGRRERVRRRRGKVKRRRRQPGWQPCVASEVGKHGFDLPGGRREQQLPSLWGSGSMWAHSWELGRSGADLEKLVLPLTTHLLPIPASSPMADPSFNTQRHSQEVNPETKEKPENQSIFKTRVELRRFALIFSLS